MGIWRPVRSTPYPLPPALIGLAFSMLLQGRIRKAFAYTDKLLKTLLITGSLERNITLGLRPSCVCAKFIAGLLGDFLNPLRAAERIKE